MLFWTGVCDTMRNILVKITKPRVGQLYIARQCRERVRKSREMQDFLASPRA